MLNVTSFVIPPPLVKLPLAGERKSASGLAVLLFEAETEILPHSDTVVPGEVPLVFGGVQFPVF